MQIGTANYDKKSGKQFDKPKDGDNLIRILPPLGSLAQKGSWYVYKAVEWGYKDSKGNLRPFQDPSKQNYKSKMWDIDTLARQHRVKMEATLKQAYEMNKAGQLSKDELEKVKELKEQFNLEKKYYVNAINLKGEIVLYKLGYKAFKDLEAEIKKLKDKGIDPLSVENGRFFNIQRSGDGFDTTYKVSVASENVEAVVNGEKMIVQKEIKHALDEAIIKRLATEATDLGTLDETYPIVTAEQVDMIVKEGPVAVDRILGVKEDNKSSAPKQQAAQAPAQESPAPEAQASAAAETPAPETAKQETAASTPAPEAKKEEIPSSPAPAPDKAAFLASLGINA